MFVSAILSCATTIGQVADDEFDKAMAALAMVDTFGQGHEAAVQAMTVLNQATPDRVPQLLQGMNGANPLVRTWLSGAIQSALDGASEMPVEAIRAFFEDHSQSDVGRQLAFELLTENDPSLAEQWLPQLVDDPALALRRRSIDWYIQQAQDAESPQDLQWLTWALKHARAVDQISELAGELEKRGIQVDLQQQLGFINTWQLVGPFDNRNEEGFDRPNGPERDLAAIDVQAIYEDGRDGEAINWEPHQTADTMAVVNLNDAIGKVKGATAYAMAEFESDEERPCEIRIGCINANKVWLNGELVLSNEVYHVGMMPDQFKGAGTLLEGTNTILVKICQNEQEQPWAQDWMFQVRVCDESGAAILPGKKDPEE